MNMDDVAWLVEELRNSVVWDERNVEVARRIEEAADTIEAQAEEKKALQSRIEALEAALRFYARENSWKSCGVYMSGQSQPSSAEVDRGNKARKALENQP